MLDEPVNLPEGASVRVMIEVGKNAETPEDDLCMDGNPWPQTPEEIREWVDWFDALEPIMTEEEYQRFEAWRLEEKERQKELNRQSCEAIDRSFR